MKTVCFFVLSALFVYAQSQSTGDVRLVNGTNTGGPVGRLEIYLNGAWSTVCADDGFCTNVATVVCRQLGFSTIGAQAYGLAQYGQGSGTVGAQNFNCIGSETNVSQCTYTTPSTCPHTMDAAVSCRFSTLCSNRGHSSCCSSGCYVSSGSCWCDSSCHTYNDCCPGIEYTCPAGGAPPPSLPPPSTSCSTVGDIEFVAGDASDGRLKVCDTDYRWKTVCSSGFDNNEATVICRSLGLSTSNFTIYPVTQYGQGTEDIYAKNLSCTTGNSEAYLTDCAGSDVCCGHHNDVGLSCQPACTDGQARFVGGSTSMEGRLEVCNNGRWGTVCDDFWGINDARVACKMAGLPWRGAVAYSGPQVSNLFGSGFGPIWLDNVQCTGSETDLFSCTANAIGSHNCAHYEDAGAKCAPGPCELAGYTSTCCDPTTSNCQGINSEEVCHCSPDCEEHGDCCIDYTLACRCNNNELRLRGGTVPSEGRVELCYNGVWGTVCDDFWNAPDARVVCRQLGYTYNLASAQALSFAYFGAGTGSIWLDNVFCSGTETHLVNCSSNAIGSHNCGHYEDASVRCAVEVPATCQHGAARLVRGPNEREGQLEVCYNGQWGTVCDDFFGQVDANVVCKTIFPSDPVGGALFIQYSYQYFGYSTLNNIVMDNVQCTGNEPNITSCPHITNHNCYRWEDVGIACYQPGSYNNQPALVPGPNAGRLQVYSTTTGWGTVCRNSFDLQDARVVCRELGLPTGSPRVYVNLQFNRGYGSTSSIYKNVACTGNETNLNNCSLSKTGYCSHYWDVGVGCEQTCGDGQIRLVGGTNATEGRLEVCRDGQWGTVCDDPNSRSFATEEAVVICKQLGLPYTAAQVKSFGAGADPIHYSNLDCVGSESNLASCSRNMNPSCSSHTYDVGVTCSDACQSHEVRLVGGSSPSEGRLEICLGGAWGTVCDSQFHNVDASVVCKQLGLPYGGAEATYDAYFGQGDDHVAITNLYCTGNENSLLECNYQTGSSVPSFTCSHANDAGVICQDPCSNGAIRVAGASLPNAGRVEICYYQQWGTVCDKNWDTPDVQVACYQLGYERSPVRAFGGSKYGPGNGDIFFRDTACAGTEAALGYCISNTDTSECTHNDDAGIQCNGAAVLPTATPVQPTGPPPEIVSNITHIFIDDNTHRVTWSPPLTTNGIITNYTVTIQVIGGSMPPNVTTILGNKARLVTFTTLMAGVPYLINITASNIYGAGDVYSYNFFTRELAPNTPVTITQPLRVDENTISFSWIPLTFYQARGNVTGYQVSYAIFQEGVNPQWIRANVSSTTTSWTSPNTLTPSERYAVTVAGITTVGLGLPTNPITIVPTTSTAYFQLKIALNAGQQCGTWTTESSTAKLTAIVNTVVIEINKQCQNCFSPALIAQQRFQCNPDASESDQVTFRAQLFAPGTRTATDIVGFVGTWVTGSTTASASVNIDGVDFAVDSSCSAAVSDFNADFCTTSRPTTATGSASGLGTGATAGISAAVVITVLAAACIVAVVIVFVLVFNHRAKKFPDNDVVGYSNRMAFPEGGDDNISQHMGSTVHDDDFQEALNMISDDIDDKAKLASNEGRVYMNT